MKENVKRKKIRNLKIDAHGVIEMSVFTCIWLSLLFIAGLGIAYIIGRHKGLKSGCNVLRNACTRAGNLMIVNQYSSAYRVLQLGSGIMDKEDCRNFNNKCDEAIAHESKLRMEEVQAIAEGLDAVTRDLQNAGYEIYHKA
jgi:hypothetical protein